MPDTVLTLQQLRAARAAAASGGRPKVKRKEDLEGLLAAQIAGFRLDVGMVRQYRFHPTRRWPFDFAWPAAKIAIEVDGGLFVRGAHSGPGQLKDMEKRNEAAILGWRVLVVSGPHIKDKHHPAIDWLQRALSSAAKR